MFCESDIPTPEQRLICTACGHGDSAGVELDATSQYPGRYRGHTCSPSHPRLLNTVELPPEELHEQLGLPPWEAPYVWETNY